MSMLLCHFVWRTHTHDRYLISQHILRVQSDLNSLTLAQQRQRQRTPPTLHMDMEYTVQRDKLHDALSSATMVLHGVEAMDSVEPERVMGIKTEGRMAVVIMYSLLVFVIGIVQYAFYGTVTNV